MRELTVRIRFTRHCLGNAQDRARNDGRLVFARTPGGQLVFLPTWHARNMHLAAQLLGRHHGEVERIRWDVAVDATLRGDPWYKRYYDGRSGRQRFCWHEALFPGEGLAVHCAVPSSISNEDLQHLMQLAGRYKGLSPWKPGEFGHFEVEGVERRGQPMNMIETTTDLAGTNG